MAAGREAAGPRGAGGGRGEPAVPRRLGPRSGRGVGGGPAGRRAGAAWYRRFPAADPGYGFVDEATPEVTVGMRPRYRGNGIGEALCERAKADGYGRLSLSVEQANPAAMLYTRLGFRTVAEAGGSWRMVRVLG